ncbi:hypothetical protein CFAM422_007344 [Trichoderma lentiforme]|uniref:Uncharacterized protein n=1 Tax=Trichoderma lentiforme TaxID=1567552 RepID=A0A9P5CDJ9_9HYPO|nr:hypothetical protein CFAM422_007344 [Trichoderma lentiforme]
MGIDLASGSQGWELVAESPSAISSGQPLRAEVRYSQLKPRAACPKGPSGAFYSYSRAAGQGSESAPGLAQGSPLALERSGPLSAAGYSAWS